MRIELLVGIFLAGLSVHAAETNVVYPFDSGGEWTCPYEKRPDVINAQTNIECRPASEFPEGNWGKPNLGYQLSLRFPKKVYAKGEPVVATLLLRNLTNKLLNFYALSHIMGGPVHFHVTTQAGDQLAETRYYPGAISGSSWSPQLAPLTQQRFVEDLNKGFNLTNGQYRIQAFISVPTNGSIMLEMNPPSPGRDEVRSGEVSIKIRK